MSHARLVRKRSLAALLAVTSAAAIGLGVPAHAADSGADTDSESAELLARFGEMDAARTAPTGLVAPGAYSAAYAQLSSLPANAAAWTEVTRTPYFSDDPRYRDPGASNSSAGSGYVTGRIQGLAVDNACVFVGAAGGGVSRSCDGGTHWTPISDTLPTQSIGYLAVASDGALWLATGDGTTGSTTYVGTGVYRLTSPDSSSFSPANRIGGTELESQVIRKLVFDVPSNKVFVAASRGVYSHPLVGGASTAWTNVLAPCRSGQLSCADVNSSYWDIANDVAVQPGSNGQVILANVAWRSGAAYNGFYLSTNAGASWTKINPTGAINPKDIGNATFAYGADGTHLYVVLESPAQLNAGAASALQGVYVSLTGAVAGPYNQIANSAKLAQSGSAERKQRIGGGYQPGVQAWYNQFAGVDPANPNHVYLGLEEVYESWDAGQSWNTIGRYWNFGMDCWSYLDSLSTCDGNVVHSDQHAIAFGTGSSAGQVFVGNDGGVYRRSIAAGTTSWTSLSRSGQLDALQYYSVAVGKNVQPGAAPGSVQIWGGLQDNGVSLLDPANPGQVSPFGGDGGDQLVDANNGCRTVGEYVNLTLQMTLNCGKADGSPASDGAIINIDPEDPLARFIAPFSADQTDANTWVAGGEFVWVNTKTWASTSGADWTQAADSGAGHSITSLASRNHTVWAGWCGSCNPGGAFNRGLLSNAGGSGYHQVAMPSNVPLRMVTGVTPDPTDASSAYVVFGGYSRAWTDGPGNLAAGTGHLWKVTATGTVDGAGNEQATWTDVSGNLPDIPGDYLLITSSGRVVMGTDLGVVETTLASLQTGSPSWTRDAVPATIATKLVAGPDGKLYAATFGRGIWSTTL